MAMTINTNVVSINAQRNLGLSGNSLATSMQRLSSGLRVNSAKDDAAGLAIAERMSTQVRGLSVASRNANDGISLAQTAEGALGKVGDMLQRMRELSVQSGNATNSKSDREALQSELKQLSDEVDRVAKTTSFNGKKLLDGSFNGATFQVGANSGDNITVGALGNAKVASLGNSHYAEGAVANAAVTGAMMTGADVSITITGADGASSTATIGKMANAPSDQEALGAVIAAINSKTADTGVTAYITDDGKGFDLRGTIKEGGTYSAMTITASGGTSFPTSFTTGSTEKNPTTGISDLDISTQKGAWDALQKIDGAITSVNSARADLGAVQTRFDKATENIDIQSENITAARGRITDADFAKETANLSRTQILQQAGTAMVAQANQLPQQVLSLLR
ncbi:MULTISPECIES: flagellin [Comamonas]|uniref:flagellin n=1 Tax=Comamonas TaxID=283 RepID=UPI0015F80326|nr:MULTISPECIES: flagellin [Comamonas]UUC94250.1 flagellin [Comamonas sp. C11]WEE78274.1 flagellin [Comamonas testosteroni]